jgi:RimJ/RimL family protein N-acetyltransferase
MSSSAVEGLGVVSIRAVDLDHPQPPAASTWDDWGDMDPAAKDMDLQRWIIEVTDDSGRCVAVGSMSAHSVWYGPTPGSRALNIGISLAEEHRGRGIGAIAQRLLAEELHESGTVRVEASTDVENVAEQRALAKAGYELEGTLRLAQARRDGLHDLQVWAHVRAPHEG